jgi:beta-lactamase class D
MKKTKVIIYILSIFIILTTYVIKNAYADCVILADRKKFIINEGDCKTRYTPASTFKIAISLMGYNEGILIDENNPKVNPNCR